MTIQECYQKLEGDYDDVLERLQMDSLIKKFVLKFPGSCEIEPLKKAAEEGDVEAAFMAAHTIKGVAGNLSFTALQNVASELTEQLRPRPDTIDQDLVKKVVEKYALVAETIEEFSKE